MPRANNGPRLESNERGIYEVRWTESGRSKRRSTGTANRSEAQKVLAGFLMEMERNGDETRSRVLVGEALDFYWSGHVEPKVAAKDRIGYAFQPLRAFFGEMEVADITPADVDDYCRRRRTGKLGRRVTDSTIRRELGTLVAALSFAVRKQKLSRNDVPTIELPEGGQPRERHLTQSECDLLLATAKPGGRLHAFLMVALHTGARKRAIETLTWLQVDLERGTVNFNEAGRKQTKKRRPLVPLSTELWSYLREARQRRPADSYVLRHPGAIRKSFETLTHAAGFADVTPHTLRHTWATLAAQHGVSMWDIAGTLGDTVETVTRNYLKHSPDHLRGAVNFRRPVAPEQQKEEIGK